MNEIITQKICTKCGELQDASQFVKDPQKKDGLYSSCKTCYKKRRNENREADIERCKKYKRENRDAYLERKRKSWWDNREENLAKLAERHAKNKEKEIEYRRANGEKLNLISKAWAFINRDRVTANTRKWRKNNPEKVSVQKNNRRALEHKGGIITNDEWMALVNKFGNKCLCCGRSDVRITLDHVIPLSIGGLNVIENAQPLCASCNSRKNNKHIDYRLGYE